jgi:hypothetical protein
LLKTWATTAAGNSFPNYAAGSEGPAEAAKVLVQSDEEVSWIDFSKYDNVCAPIDMGAAPSEGGAKG